MVLLVELVLVVEELRHATLIISDSYKALSSINSNHRLLYSLPHQPLAWINVLVTQKV